MILVPSLKQAADPASSRGRFRSGGVLISAGAVRQEQEEVLANQGAKSSELLAEVAELSKLQVLEVVASARSALQLGSSLLQVNLQKSLAALRVDEVRPACT